MRESSRSEHPAAALRVEEAIAYIGAALLPHANRTYEVPVAEAESLRAKLEADQAAWRRNFGQAASEAQPILQRLAEAGEADLEWVLAQVLRCADLRSAEVPRPRSLNFKLKPATLPPTGAHTPDGLLVLTARKTLRGRLAARKKGSPAEMLISVKMALLDRRLRQTTRRRRHAEIAGLFRAFAHMIWGRACSYLGEDHVRQRIIRVKRKYAKELSRQIDFGENFRRALQYDRMFLARGGGPGSRTQPRNSL